MKKEDFLRLTTKIANGEASPEEIALYNAYYNRMQENVPDEMNSSEAQIIEQRLLTSIHEQLHFRNPKTAAIKRRIYISAAASILLLMTFTIWYYSNTTKVNTPQIVQHVIKPGGNNAVLTLADGTKIVLNHVANGKIATQSGITVTKTQDGMLQYTVSQAKGELPESPAYHTLETPTGGQFEVNLPDGSKVWLNASSSIRFPTKFYNNVREVTLSGEAYFEVFENKKMPFRVITAHQTVEVLGTKFNLSSYADDLTTTTTLAQGSVKVRLTNSDLTYMIKPGQKTVLTNNNATVQLVNADVEGEIAWKNGMFMFESEDITSIMRKISRWYNVDIVYNGQKSNEKYNGIISRFENVSKTLEMLEKTNTIKFKIEGRRIIVN